MAGRGRRGGFPRVLGRSVRVRRRRLAFAGLLAAVLAAGAAATGGLGADAMRAAVSSSGTGHALTPPPSAVAAAPSAAPLASRAAAAPPAAAPSSAAGEPASGEPAWQEMPAAIADIVSQFASTQGAAGVAVAVSTGSGATTHARYLTTVGQSAAQTPWSADTRSGFRSITKSLVGTVVLQLAAEGKLGLDDPLAKYVPAVGDMQHGGAAAGGQITVREALEMRTGLPEFSSTQAFSDRLNADYTAAFTDDQLLGYALAEPLSFAPGTHYEYSNTNFVVLGEAIEAVTGSTWDRAVQSRILGPLGLASVAYSGAGDPAGPVATPYQATNAGLERLAQVSPSMYGASGGYFGSIGDLLAWGRALGSGSLLPAPLQQQRFTAVSNPETDDPGSPEYDGYGLAAGSIDGWWGHSGTGLGYESLTLYQPSTGTTVAILINTQLDDPNGPAALFKQLESSLSDLG